MDLSQQVWAADNGCFRQPRAFNGSEFVAWLRARQRWRSGCRFVVAPDVPLDAAATWRRSLPWFTTIRQLGYRVALAAQNGAADTPIDWTAFDVLFVAGSTEWKFGSEACALMREAHARGMPIHMARVNSLRKLRAAADVGCATADGTFITFAPDQNVQRVQGWLTAMERQPTLWR